MSKTPPPAAGLSLAEAEALVFRRTDHDSGRYYGAIHADLGIGVGLFFSNVRMPIYDEKRGLFVTRTFTVLVLTHECDIDQANQKAFNNDVLVAPLAPFEAVFETLKAKRSDAEIKSYLGDLAAGRITQLMYLPHWPERFPNGVVLYLNRITHTHLAEFSREGVSGIGALTGYGLQQLHSRLSTHLLREKQDRLPLSG
jgi:hypothetical protein